MIQHSTGNSVGQPALPCPQPSVAGPPHASVYEKLNDVHMASDGGKVQGALVAQAKGVGGGVGLVEVELHLLNLVSVGGRAQQHCMEEQSAHLPGREGRGGEGE